MKKYLLISHKYGDVKRGAFLTSERFAEDYPNHLVSKEDIKCKDLDYLSKDYKKLIFVTQVPHIYSIPVSFITLKDLDHIIFIRNRYNMALYNSASNGFYYYLDAPNIKNFIPFVTDFTLKDNKLLNEICIGVYYRPNFVVDAASLLREFLDSLRFPVNLYIMGYDDLDILNHEYVETYNHTYDNQEFFSNITHYLHLKSSHFIDPFPNTLMEAIQTNKQIIIFGPKERKFRDGVDDVENVILYHTEFSDTYLDNSNHIFKPELFKNFYMKLFENNFEYTFDRSVFKSFTEWFEREVI